MTAEPLIILAAPFSGASRLCAMLGQHPAFAALPCLNLFVEDAVEGLLSAHARAGGSDGLLRALAWLRERSQGNADIAVTRQWLLNDAPGETRGIWEYMLDACAGKVVVEFSPSTGLQSSNLERICEWSPGAAFLHLVRHPAALRQAWRGRGRFTRGRPVWEPETGGLEDEDVWLVPNTCIHEFAETLPGGQCMRLQVEELCATPEVYLRQILEWMGVEADPEILREMAKPERSIWAAPGPDRAPGGIEQDFLEAPACRLLVDPGDSEESGFDKRTLKLAREYGYRFPGQQG